MKDEDSFDLELEKLNEGKLPDSHVFNLGKPGEILQNCGFPAEHRIELAASRLRMKANQGNHPFDILDIKGLTKALQEPVAVFEYGDKKKSQNVIVNLEKDGKNFLVGVFFNQIRDGFEVSSIRGLFNRDNMDWMHWIQQGKMIYGNKEKIQVLAEQQRTNLADVYSKEARTSSDSYYLDSVDNILQSFGDVKDIYTKNYPEYAEQKERFEIFKKFRSAYQKVEAINVLDAVQKADEFYDALKSNNKEVIARYTDAVENPELADAVEAISTVHSAINTNGRSHPDPRFSSDNIVRENEVVNKKISERQLAAGEQFPLAVLHSDTDNILSESNIVNGTTYQKIQTFSKFTEQQKNMEKEYQEYLGTISPDEESSRRIDSGEIFGKFEHQQAKEELNVSTYKFQSGENLDEIIQGNSDFPTETALLDNMIDGNIREVYEYATNEEKTVLRQFAAFRNDYDTDMKNLTVQTDCVSRWIAAKHWNPEMQEFQEDYVNHAAVAEFPYKLPWEMKEIEAQVLQTENETIDKGIESIQVNGGMSEAAMEADYEATEKENIPELKIYHTLKKDDVRNLEVISDQEFSDIVDSIILNDYKNIPNAIRLPNLNEQLSEKLGLEKDSAFILKKNATHIRPDRKGGYGQAFDAEEYRKIPEILRNADFAVVDTVFQNFQIVFDDKNDGTKINKLVFNKDELGNYLVTLGKVDRESAFSEERNPVVAVGVAPTIQTLRTSASSTALRASTTTVDESIAQSKEKATEFVVSKLKSAGIEIISDKDEFENTLAELKGNDEIIQRMAESFEKSEKLRPDNNSVLRANEEVRNILTESLDKTAEPLKEVVYSRENYVKIFEDGVIQSPVETIKMGTNQFVRLCPPDRNNLMGAIYETITKPSIVLEKETFDEKSESFKPVHVYGKSFINQDNDHKRAVESIIVFKDGQNIAASLHNKTISALVKQIKTADDIIYLDKEVSRVATFSLKAGDSHVVKETEEFLSSAGQKSLPLWNKSYDTGKILSISDLIAKGEIEGGKLEITKDNFDKYFNIFNQNIRSYKDRPNKISSDLFSFYVKPENKPEMRQWLESQGYKINENQRAEKAVLSEYTVSDGTTYGFAYNGKIYLNPDFTDSNVAVHEYTHLWDEYTKNTNPELWEKGKDIFKETHIWQEVKNDPNYSDISNNDDLVLSEVHARICGTMSQEVLERIANEEGEIVKDRAIDWNKEVNEYLFSEHGLFAKENLENERLFIEEFMSLPVKDLLNENRELKLRGQSQDELGNYRVTLGKVEAADFNSKNYTKVAVGVEPTIWRVQNEHPIATMLRSSTTLATEETIPQVVEKSINEEKTKMPDQLIYAAAEVGQVIEQRTPEAQSIVNPTRVDRLSTISVPLNKEYNEDFPLSTEKNMSETQKSINEQKTKLQILEQEDKEQLEAMVMTARETIKESLAQDAVPLVEIEFSKANYDRLFPRAIVQTPIETVKLGENQFEKLDAKDRKRFLLATFQTLATPDLVIDEEREGSHSHNYIKSFIFDEKTKAVQDVVVNINGENISITAHPRDINNVVNKIKMPDQLVYAAARVGQVIEQRVQNELGIVNPTRADRLSTISVPLNKEYNMENALSIISEFQTFKGQKTESEFQKKIDEMKKTIEARNMQEVETVTSEKKAPAKKQTTRTKADIIKQAAKDFSEAIKDGLAPFFDTKDDFQKIIMRPSAIVNAANGRPFSGESQLLAQIYHQRQKMEGEIVTSIAGAKSAGTKVLDTPESRQKNFALTDTSVLAEKNSIIRTRYFMPESCEEPEKIYSQTLQQQRPEKIRSYRDLIRHFENIPNGQKEISDIRIRIAHEHLKEIQSRFAIKEEKTLSVEEIEERKNFLRNYFERLPADYRDSERGAFEDTFGIQLDPEKTLKINLQRNFKDIDFAELKENTKKSIELENRKLNNFIEKNTMENKKLASIFKDEYKTQVKEEKQTSKNLKIEAIGIKEPETFLGKYLAACNSNAEFVTDKDTVEQVKKNLEKKLEENFKLEKYDILKEIGQQAQSISNETTKQISFEKAHSNKKNLGKAVDISAEISPLGMGK